MIATETDTIEKRLVEVEAQVASLTSHPEPRVLAKRLLDLLDRQDALRVELGSYIRCVQCGETFEVARADSRYCSSACRQAAYRRRVTDKPQRVTALTAREPRSGVSWPDGHGAGLTPRRDEVTYQRRLPCIPTKTKIKPSARGRSLAGEPRSRRAAIRERP